MPNTTTSANMNLIIPTVGTDPGPDWANNLNADLSILDQHDHSSGKGVQITTAGLTINTDLPINSNNLTMVKTVNFTAQVSTLAGSSPNLGCIYVAGNELIYNDEAGNVVAITKTGSVNAGAGSITGLPSGTASASYSSGSGTFVWQSATNTPANTDTGSVIFRNIAANSKGLTLSPPNSMASDYSATLPASNGTGSTVFLTYDSSNNMGVGPSLTGGITGTNIANLTITNANVANGTLTKQKDAVYVPQVSSSSGTFTSSSTSEVDITNQTITITTFGNPVVLSVAAQQMIFQPISNFGFALVRIVRGSTSIYGLELDSNNQLTEAKYFTPNFSFVDVVAAGTYTYKLTAQCNNSGQEFEIVNSTLTGYEI